MPSLRQLAVLLAVLCLSTPAKSDDVHLVYIGAKNCGVCKLYEATQEKMFFKTDEYKMIIYHRLVFESFTDTTDKTVWKNLHWLLKETDAKFGTPRFILFRKDTILESTAGLSSFEDDILPTILIEADY